VHTTPSQLYVHIVLILNSHQQHIITVNYIDQQPDFFQHCDVFGGSK